MFKWMSVFVLAAVVLAACSPSATPTPPLPTLAGDAAAPNEDPATSTDDEAGDLTLTQTIVSETGVTYQLPAGWDVQDNASVSNFASDEDAVLDMISVDAEGQMRWYIVGSVGTSDASRIMALEGVTDFEAASVALHEYFYTNEADIQPPTIVTLPNGNRASVSIRNNEDMEGFISVVYYIDGGNGIYINNFWEARADIIMDNLAFLEAVANSAVLR